MRAEISSEMLAAIRRECAARAPREACGLLFGEGALIRGWQAVANVAEWPETRFEIDPAALFAALRAERAGEARILGYWHSHPGGDVQPSETDARMAAADGKLWLIVTDADVSLWRAGEGGMHGRFAPVALCEDRTQVIR